MCVCVALAVVVMEVDVDVIVQYVITMVLMTRFVKQIIGITL